jgi:thermopsin
MSQRAPVVFLLIAVTVLATIGGALPAAFAHPGSTGPATAALGPASAHAAPVGTAPGTHVAAPVPSARASLAERTLSALKSAGVPQKVQYLPDFAGGGTQLGNVVSPITHVAPAPMGIGDFGVRNTSGTPTPYVIHSSSWEGSVTFNSGDFFYVDNDGPDTFGVQLNTVLANVTVEGDTSDSYWIQDVMFYTPSNGSLEFLDNIWNFSDPSTSEPASTFHSYNGTPVAPTYYFDQGPTYIVPFPFTVHLYTNSSLTNSSTNTYSTVRFGYDLVDGSGNQLEHGVYDTVEFNSNVLKGSPIPLPRFEVNGGHLTPTNFLLYDSELMIGGPGGGSTTQIYALNASMQLAYLNTGSSKWTLDPTGWTAGTDTGETSEGISEYYTTAGTMELRGGPSFVEPMWNATPAATAGEFTIRGMIDPDNAFLFVSNGTNFYGPTAAWGPIVPGGSYAFYLPPGAWDLNVLLSEYDNESFSFVGTAGLVDWQNITLFSDPLTGVYTPLFAWDNSELANISSSGAGTAANPYILDNDQVTDFPYLFGEVNDFLFPVFPGILISETTSYFVIENPPPLTVLYPPAIDRALDLNGLPDTNQLQIELYYTDHGTVWGGSDIGGWMSSSLFNFPFYQPAGELVLWGATNTLVGDNTFVDQGLGVVLMQGSQNTVWGNRFVNGLIYPASFPAQFGIAEWESGDLIYNNIFNTTITAHSPSLNLYDGNPQTNLNDWNLPNAVPAGTVSVVNGFDLSGSIVGAPTVCGNWWDDYLPGQPLPYDELISGTPFIATGGDACPDGPSGEVTYGVTFTETGATSATWSVTFANETGSASAGSAISFSIPNGTWQYSVGSVSGMTAAPADGDVIVTGAGHSVAVTYTTGSTTSNPSRYLVTFGETGLAAGTPWSVVVGSTTYPATGSSVALTAVNGSDPYTIPAVTDYTLSSSSGTVVIAGASASVSVMFTADPGWLNATVNPSGASAWVSGQSVPLSSGTFTLQETPGIYAVEFTASGYAPYFNNVSVAPVRGTTLDVRLTVVTTGNSTGPGGSSTGTTTSSSGLPSDQFYGIVLGLLIVAAAIVVAGFLMRGRSGGGSAPVEEMPPNEPPEAPAQDAPAPGGESEGDYNPNVNPQMHPWEETPPGSPPSR